MASDIQTTLQILQVPEDFSRYDNITEPEITIRLEQWKHKAFRTLADLKQNIADQNDLLSPERHAEVAAAVAVFDGEDTWIDSDIRDASKGIMSALPPPTRNIVERTLKYHVKPLFISTPHPSLHAETARKLRRPAGGPMAMFDQFDEQLWKLHPGTGNLVSWCVRNLSAEDYESLWPLVIPPTMTLLDDYQAVYRLQGISVVSDVLDNAPKALLKRTGIGELFMTSLSAGLNHLHDDRSPDIIRRTVLVTLKLIALTTAPDSEDRFNKICHILGDKIIGGVWVYASQNQDIIEASMDVLPDLLRALGIGSVRYMKALIPQCAETIKPEPYKKKSTSMQLSTLKALSVIIDVCQSRIFRWKGAIIEGVGKCWVALVDSGKENKELKNEIINIFHQLAKVCPSVIEDEYPRLKAADSVMFSPLVELIRQDFSAACVNLKR